jgi:hypothetical protein
MKDEPRDARFVNCAGPGTYPAAKVAFQIHDRGDFVLWRYTPWVQVCNVGFGAGTREFLTVLGKVRQKLEAAR